MGRGGMWRRQGVGRVEQGPSPGFCASPSCGARLLTYRHASEPERREVGEIFLVACAPDTWRDSDGLALCGLRSHGHLRAGDERKITVATGFCSVRTRPAPAGNSSKSGRLFPLQLNLFPPPVPTPSPAFRVRKSHQLNPRKGRRYGQGKGPRPRPTGPTNFSALATCWLCAALLITVPTNAS